LFEKTAYGAGQQSVSWQLYPGVHTGVYFIRQTVAGNNQCHQIRD
jgi:hypothetical protein